MKTYMANPDKIEKKEKQYTPKPRSVLISYKNSNL